MSLKDADALAPKFEISKILTDLVPSKYKLDRVIVMAPQYLKDLNKLVTDTPQEVLLTYFQWKTIQAFASYIEADAVTPILRLRNELSGQVLQSRLLLFIMLTYHRIPTQSPNAGEHVSDMLTMALAGF